MSNTIKKFLELISKLKETETLPLSYSKVNCMAACPRQFQERYLKKSKGGIAQDKESAVVGKFIHTVLEYCMERGKTYGFVLDCVDFDLTWQQVSKQMGLTMKEYNMAQAQRLHAEVVLDKLISIVTTNKLVVHPEMKVVMTKQGIVKGNTPWNSLFFQGYLDFFGVTLTGKSGLVLDYKTHMKSKENEDQVKVQTNIYSLMLLLRFPKLLTLKVGCVYIPEELFDTKIYTRDDIEELAEFALEFFNTFLMSFNVGQQEKFLPTKSRYCDWCTYTNGCSVYKK